MAQSQNKWVPFLSQLSQYNLDSKENKDWESNANYVVRYSSHGPKSAAPVHEIYPKFMAAHYPFEIDKRLRQPPPRSLSKAL
jgi:hypothetical protein